MADKALKAQDNPLGVIKKTLKDLNIPEEAFDPRRMMVFLQAQNDEFKTLVHRYLFDTVHSTRLSESDVEALKNKGLSNLTENKNMVTQFYGGLQVTQKAMDQLREEYPELQPEE